MPIHSRLGLKRFKTTAEKLFFPVCDAQKIGIETGRDIGENWVGDVLHRCKSCSPSGQVGGATRRRCLCAGSCAPQADKYLRSRL